MGRGGSSAADWVAEYLSVDQVINRLAREYEATLTQDEASALRSYSRNVHKPVNGYLRGLNDDAVVAESWVPLLDAALAKAVPAPRELRLYRSFASKQFFLRALKKGSEFTDPGYCSTSTSFDLTKSFRESPYGIRLEIAVPEGTRIAPLGDLADNPCELEVLLPRGSRFRVERDKRNLLRRERGLQLTLIST